MPKSIRGNIGVQYRRQPVALDLAQRIRRRVLPAAAQSEKLCVCEIQAHFDLGQPTISHHLKILREAGLVMWEKRGLWVYYSLNRPTLEQATAYLNNLLSQSSLSSLSKSAVSAG